VARQSRVLQLRGKIRRMASKDSEGGKEQKTGYQFGDLFINKLTGKDNYEFGDLSRLVSGKLQEAVGNFTGKDEYEFGDLSRTLDVKAKNEVKKITGKETYEFGDISKFLDAKAKEQVCNLTGKEEYKFGDISREIARRVQEGEVDREELFLLLRLVLALGAGLLPVAHVLPVQVLLNLYTSSLEVEVGQKVTSKVSVAIAEELDRRAKGSILGKGNEDYVLGDFTKAQMQKAVASVTGKESYEFGDITKAFLSKVKPESRTGK